MFKKTSLFPHDGFPNKTSITIVIQASEDFLSCHTASDRHLLALSFRRGPAGAGVKRIGLPSGKWVVKKRASHRATIEAVHPLGCSRRQTSTLGALNIVDVLAGKTFRVTALAALLAIGGA